MSILSQTQMMLAKLLEEREEDRQHRVRFFKQLKEIEKLVQAKNREVQKWRSMYDDLAEPLQRAAEYCGILPPKTMYKDTKHLSPYEKIALYEPLTLQVDMNAHISPTQSYHTMQMQWVYAMVDDHPIKLQKIQHYRLRFNDGRQLAYSFTDGMSRLHTKRFLIQEIATLFANKWGTGND